MPTWKVYSMKVAIIGSRNLTISNLGEYLPPETTEIVSGGARGIDTCARTYARAHDIALREFHPDYARYGHAAPLRRNQQIVDYADMVLAFWDGQSRGTAHVINICEKKRIMLKVIRIETGEKPLV